MLSAVRARAAQAARASAAGVAALGGARAMSSIPAERKVAPFFDDDKPSYPIVEGVNDHGARRGGPRSTAIARDRTHAMQHWGETRRARWGESEGTEGGAKPGTWTQGALGTGP